jgi:hypothetical protein
MKKKARVPSQIPAATFPPAGAAGIVDHARLIGSYAYPSASGV